MTLHISTSQYQRMREALEATYPQEGCGVLVGKRVFELGADTPQPGLQAQAMPQDAYREVVQVIPVANAWEPGLLDEVGGEKNAQSVGDLNRGDRPHQTLTHGAHDRYWIDPADLLRIQKEARDQDLEIIGIVHSHPDHPAIPSECDRQLAWPVYSYVIASVREGQVVDVQSWRLNEAQQFEAESITIL
ncbi:hypothetical protein GFS31_39390 [Leptolyngbya sp. BL0902]|uniref:Mov34/MPN/PAD-1 family protein n=1 Tax=Leptolyngbya sp. BL0902 TaxID=1115757 RepID=UPI0018E7BF7D|nr:M67 family metallopeptidase [Leptolyngbya sp. BL0902]QQE67226.1 hypothetical protein GFS31_39390 [Leptolyngbya sp. BL0902]